MTACQASTRQSLCRRHTLAPPSPPPPRPFPPPSATLPSPPPPPAPPPPHGCTLERAVNYRSFAMVDDGSCVFGGCTDSRFSAFNPHAKFDDGSCPPVIYGCTDTSAVNYRRRATVSDASCRFGGCRDPRAKNFSPKATLRGKCKYARRGCTNPAGARRTPDIHQGKPECLAPGVWLTRVHTCFRSLFCSNQLLEPGSG